MNESENWESYAQMKCEKMHNSKGSVVEYD